MPKVLDDTGGADGTMATTDNSVSFTTTTSGGAVTDTVWPAPRLHGPWRRMWIHQMSRVVLLVVFLVLSGGMERSVVQAEEQTSTSTTTTHAESSTSSSSPSSSPPRVLTPAELAAANGVDSDLLYLCLFGKVYDVAAGAEYYSPDGGPYHIFVATDAPVPFVTGVFDEVEAAKPWDAVDVTQHGSYVQWVDFYDTEDKYPYVGVVQGVFYDAEGQPTDEQRRVEQALAAARIEIKRKEEERQRRRAERKKKQQQQQQQQQQQRNTMNANARTSSSSTTTKKNTEL